MCVAGKETWSGESRHSGRQTGRQEDRQAGRNIKEREIKRQSNRAVSLFIDSHVCTNESLSVPPAGPHAVFRPQHD